MNVIDKISDNRDKTSISHGFRSRRFQFFRSLLQQVPKPVSILDIGGTQQFWEAMDFNEPGVTVTLLNLEEQPVNSAAFKIAVGDATQLQFPDNAFDIVFSNSVIEHLFTAENQQKMAAEIQRVGKRYFIQTPNYWFPIEPHWVFPFFQYLPFAVRVALTKHFSLGHIQKKHTAAAAQQQVREIQLLSLKNMKQLFPQANIYKEKFLALNKSFVAYKF